MISGNEHGVISLFCGAGGLDLGFEQAQFEVLAAYDTFEAAVHTHNSNRARVVARTADVFHLSAVDIVHDIERNQPTTSQVGVIGGPPCQAFSRSNVYPRADDIRRTLPGQFARLLRELQTYVDVPYFVFENVQGLTFARHKQEFARFRFLFEDAGFVLYETLLNARDYGVPQDRPRVFIVGINKTLGHAFSFPAPESTELTVYDAFQSAFGEEPWPEPAFFRRDLTRNEIPFHPNHWTMQPKSPKFDNGFLKEGQIKGRSFRVLAWDRPSWTVAYGHREIHVHPSGKRRLSIFEAMLLQGFPIEYVLHGTLSDQVKLVSDAVPPPLAYRLGQEINDLLERVHT